MSLERFIYNKNGTVPKVSITERKQFIFNQGAIDLLDLIKNQYIALYYDKKAGLIGFKSEYNQLYDNSRIVLNAKIAMLSATAFYDFYGLKYDKTIQYTIRDINGFYSIKL